MTYQIIYLLIIVGITNSKAQEHVPAKPNIIYILADDLGYGDLGCYGQQKIKTPHIDKMASEGLIFTHHYAGSTVCAPSRASLMTGTHTGHVSVRGNKSHEPEGQFSLKEELTLAEMLKKQGYKTAAFGKWGLGFVGEKGDPNNQGFDKFYGYNCQTQAHRYYPTHLWDNDKRIILEGNDGEHTRQYAHDLIHDKAMAFLDNVGDAPFFLFLPYTIPHLELIVPDDEILAQYKGKFPETPYEGVDGSAYGLGWDFSKYCPQAFPHATYAAMVSRLDRNVGEILAKLEDLGLMENTLVIFTSDNGPDYKGGADPDFFNSAGGLRGYKRDLYEGGIRVPMIAWWPGRIAPGRTDHVSAFWDVMPTIADLVELDPGNKTDGVSFLPTLLGKGNQQQHDYLYWEFVSDGLERQAILKGDWKVVKVKSSAGITTEMFNIKEDPRETTDLSHRKSKILDTLKQCMKQVHVRNDDFPISMADE